MITTNNDSRNGGEGQGVAAATEVEPIDDRGTDQSEASQILKNVRDSAFEQSDEKLALALGRTTTEVEEWTSGQGTIDEDVLMKARALGLERAGESE